MQTAVCKTRVNIHLNNVTELTLSVPEDSTSETSKVYYCKNGHCRVRFLQCVPTDVTISRTHYIMVGIQEEEPAIHRMLLGTAVINVCQLCFYSHICRRHNRSLKVFTIFSQLVSKNNSTWSEFFSLSCIASVLMSRCLFF